MAKVRKTKIELEIVRRVAGMRHKKKFSQDNIAAVLECSRGYIGQIESPNNPGTYNISQLNRLAFEFECSLHELIPEQPVPEEDRE